MPSFVSALPADRFCVYRLIGGHGLVRAGALHLFVGKRSRVNWSYQPRKCLFGRCQQVDEVGRPRKTAPGQSIPKISRIYK